MIYCVGTCDYSKRCLVADDFGTFRKIHIMMELYKSYFLLMIFRKMMIYQAILQGFIQISCPLTHGILLKFIHEIFFDP